MLDAEILGDGDLDMVDVAAVPTAARRSCS